jgi:hypothetical protein
MVSTRHSIYVEDEPNHSFAESGSPLPIRFGEKTWPKDDSIGVAKLSQPDLREAFASVSNVSMIIVRSTMTYLG